MYENFNGSSSDNAEGAQTVAGWLSVEPEDGIPFVDDDKGLKLTERKRGMVWLL